jgi:lysozyme
MTPTPTTTTPSPSLLWTPGIDISHYQGTIDWPAVAASGVRFAFCKATQGATYIDPTLAANLSGAQSAGILTGAYLFFTPDATPSEQALHFRYTLADLPPCALPPALDVEETVSPAYVLDCLQLLYELYAPVKPLLYCDPSYAQSLAAAVPGLLEYPLWIAEYGVAVPNTAPWPEWAYWQHTSGGTVPGISTPVDLDWAAAPTVVTT